MKKFLLFDWGNTIMVDFELPGPMYTWDRAAWVPGAEEALKQLSDYTCCLATNAGQSDSVAVRKGLAMVGAEKYFRFIFTSSDIGYEKPEAEFFDFILQALDGDPAECIMTGDNYRKDIEGAKRAGMKTVFFNRTNDPGSFPMADSVIYRMMDLPAVIEAL
jgi:HAD superfamily hydrolase (TIGR01509 family)